VCRPRSSGVGRVIGVIGVVRRRVHRGRELALQPGQQLEQVVHRGVAHEQAARSEDLVLQPGVRGDLGERRLEDGARRGVGPISGCALGDEADPVVGVQRVPAPLERLTDLGRQHGLPGARRPGRAHRRHEGVTGPPLRHEHQAGVGAELAGAERQGRQVCLGQAVRVGGHHPGEQDDGVGRRHLGVDGDRPGPGGRGGDQRQTAPAGAREAHGQDARVGDQGRAELGAEAVDEGEHARWHTGAGGGGGDGPGHELGGAGVSGVGLDDDGTPGGQRRGRVPSGGGEGEGKVAGPEHRHRAERHVTHPEVGAGERGPLGPCGVDPDVEVVALPDDLGEHPQLPAGPATLTGEPGRRQPGLRRGAVEEGIAQVLDLVGDGIEERGPSGRRRGGVLVRCPRGGRRRLGQLVDVQSREPRRQLAPGRRVGCGEGPSRPDDIAPSNDGVASERDGRHAYLQIKQCCVT